MKTDDIDYMDFGMGWWFYFSLRGATDEEFRLQFIEELEKNFMRGDDVVDQNGKAKKRVAVQRVR